MVPISFMFRYFSDEISFLYLSVLAKEIRLYPDSFCYIMNCVWTVILPYLWRSKYYAAISIEKYSMTLNVPITEKVKGMFSLRVIVLHLFIKLIKKVLRCYAVYKLLKDIILLSFVSPVYNYDVS